MTKQGWANDPIRAAGGRRRYNAMRQEQARQRRQQVAELFATYGLARGSGVAMARHLGVSEATISRDVKALLQSVDRERCHACGGVAVLPR